MGVFDIKKALLAAQPLDPSLVGTLTRNPVSIAIGWRRLQPWLIKLDFDKPTRLHTLAIHTHPKKPPSITLVFEPRTGRAGLLPKGFDASRQLDVSRIGQSVEWVDNASAALAVFRRRYHQLRGVSPAQLVFDMLQHMDAAATPPPARLASA